MCSTFTKHPDMAWYILASCVIVNNWLFRIGCCPKSAALLYMVFQRLSDDGWYEEDRKAACYLVDDLMRFVFGTPSLPHGFGPRVFAWALYGPCLHVPSKAASDQYSQHESLSHSLTFRSSSAARPLQPSELGILLNEVAVSAAVDFLRSPLLPPPRPGQPFAQHADPSAIPRALNARPVREALSFSPAEIVALVCQALRTDAIVPARAPAPVGTATIAPDFVSSADQAYCTATVAALPLLRGSAPGAVVRLQRARGPRIAGSGIAVGARMAPQSSVRPSTLAAAPAAPTSDPSATVSRALADGSEASSGGGSVVGGSIAAGGSAVRGDARGGAARGAVPGGPRGAHHDAPYTASGLLPRDFVERLIAYVAHCARRWAAYNGLVSTVPVMVRSAQALDLRAHAAAETAADGATWRPGRATIRTADDDAMDASDAAMDLSDPRVAAGTTAPPASEGGPVYDGSAMGTAAARVRLRRIFAIISDTIMRERTRRLDAARLALNRTGAIRTDPAATEQRKRCAPTVPPSASVAADMTEPVARLALLHRHGHAMHAVADRNAPDGDDRGRLASGMASAATALLLRGSRPLPGDDRPQWEGYAPLQLGAVGGRTPQIV